MLKNTLLKKILTETWKDVLESSYGTGLHFRLYDSTAFVGYFVGYQIVEMCSHSGCPKVTSRFLCFDTEGYRTNCDPHFDDIAEKHAYHDTMQEVYYWKNQINIKQNIDELNKSVLR